MGFLPTPIRSLAALIAALLGVALIAGWGVGRVVTDRWVWSQWVFWVPPILTAGVAVVLLAISRVLRFLGANKHGLGSMTRRIGLVGLAVMMFVTVVIDWRYWAWPVGWLAAAPSGPRMRVVVWNAASNKCPGALKTLGGLSPDLIVLSNPPGDVSSDELKAMMGDGGAVARVGVFAVASKWAVVRYGQTSLGLGGRIFQFDKTDLTPGLTEHIDDGSAAFVELDTAAALGRNLIVWAVDLPSDPFLGRAEVMRKARAAIAAWAGPENRPGPKGAVKATPATGGFPAPDLIVGDFNTPRGSGSLKQLTGDLSSAYSEAGMGQDGTWPREWPLFHIDQMFVAGWLRAREYRVVDPGESTHRLQVGEIEKAK